MAEESRGNNGTYQLITPPNLLKVKVGNSDGAPGFDLKAIELATGAVDNLADEFEERLKLETALITKLSKDMDANPDRAERLAKKIVRIARDIGGLGSTYGYELISDACESLCRYFELIGAPNRASGEVVRAHTEAMRAAMNNRVRGDGGDLGKELVNSLEGLVDRMI